MRRWLPLALLLAGGAAAATLAATGAPLSALLVLALALLLAGLRGAALLGRPALRPARGARRRRSRRRRVAADRGGRLQGGGAADDTRFLADLAARELTLDGAVDVAADVAAATADRGRPQAEGCRSGVGAAGGGE